MGNEFYYFLIIFQGKPSNDEIILKLAEIKKKESRLWSVESFIKDLTFVLQQYKQFGISKREIILNRQPFTILFGADYEDLNFIFRVIANFTNLDGKYFPEQECTITVNPINKRFGYFFLSILTFKQNLEQLEESMASNEIEESLDEEKKQQIIVLKTLAKEMASNEFQKLIREEIASEKKIFNQLKEKIQSMEMLKEDLTLLIDFMNIGIDYGYIIRIKNDYRLKQQLKGNRDKVYRKRAQELKIKLSNINLSIPEEFSEQLSEQLVQEHVNVFTKWKKELEKRLRGAYTWDELEVVIKILVSLVQQNEKEKKVEEKGGMIRNLKKKLTVRKDAMEEITLGLKLYLEAAESIQNDEMKRPEISMLEKVQMNLKINEKITIEADAVQKEKEKVVEFIDYVEVLLNYAVENYQKLLVKGLKNEIEMIEEKFWYTLRYNELQIKPGMVQLVECENPEINYLPHADLVRLANVFPKVLERLQQNELYVLTTRSLMGMINYIAINELNPYYYTLLTELQTKWHLPNIALLESFYRYNKEEQYRNYIEKSIERVEYDEKHPVEAKMRVPRKMYEQGVLSKKQFKELEENIKKTTFTPMSEILKKYEEKDRKEKEEKIK